MNYDKSKPLQYIDDFDSKKHMVLLYEDQQYAREIAFLFIRKGLQKGESCVYATDEETQFVESSMKDKGIDVDKFKEKQLYIHKIKSIGDQNLLETARDNMTRILRGVSAPSRVVAKPFPSVDTEEQISANLQFEEEFNTFFYKLQSSIMCLYQVTDILGGKNKKWLLEILRLHNVAIFAPKNFEGRAFEIS